MQQDDDFRVFAPLFSGVERDEREVLMTQLKKQPSVCEMLRVMMEYLGEFPKKLLLELWERQLREKILSGGYGTFPQSYFARTDVLSQKVQKAVLRGMVQRQYPYQNRNLSLLQSVLLDATDQRVVFHQNRFRDVCYVIFQDEKTEERELAFSLCCYFFADLFLTIEDYWNIYPVTLEKGKIQYRVVAEGEQRCGTLV